MHTFVLLMLLYSLRSFSTILLIIIIFLQTFTRFAVEADYFINKSYIAKVLCTNKEKPKMHCNGKCYLAKQLKEQEKQNQQVPVAKKSKIEVEWFHLSRSIQIIGNDQIGKEEYQTIYLFKVTSYHHSVFRPPTV